MNITQSQTNQSNQNSIEERKKKSKKFVKWMNRNEFKLHSLTKFCYICDECGYGLIAREKIQENETLFVVPSTMVLSPATSDLPPKLSKVTSSLFISLSNWNKLIICLMWEWTNPESRWRPYLDILPDCLSTPLFWSDEELKFLKGTDVQKRIGFQQIKDDYDKNIFPIISTETELFKLSTHNFDLYKRFGSIVMAYSFTECNSEVIMMPMADMLNHKTGFISARLFVDDNNKEPKYKMLTIKQIKQGEEIYNTYGDLGNSELLRKYGFVDENNPFNSVEIPLQLLLQTIQTKITNSKYNKIINFLKDFKIIEKEEDEVFLLSNDGKIPMEMEYIVRIFHTNEEEFNNLKNKLIEKNDNDNDMDRTDRTDPDGTPSCSSSDYDIESDMSGNDSNSAMQESSSSDEQCVEVCVSDVEGVKDTLIGVINKRLSLYDDDLGKEDGCFVGCRNYANAVIVRNGEKSILNKCFRRIQNKQLQI